MSTNGDIVRELASLPASIRPLQFGNHVTGSQYLPIYRLAKQYAKPGLKALDWGCGNGHFSYFLLRQGLKVDGFSLEADSNALAPYLCKKFPDAYSMVTGDLDNPVHLPCRQPRWSAFAECKSWRHGTSQPARNRSRSSPRRPLRLRHATEEI